MQCLLYYKTMFGIDVDGTLNIKESTARDELKGE